nr:MAG TPA: NicB-like protein [Caudoviricetes sp.]
MKTAIFIDGAFFLKRMQYLYAMKPDFNTNSASDIVSELETICYKHLNGYDKDKKMFIREHTLYRIFFYDCAPLQKKAHQPISNLAIDFAKTTPCKLRMEIHKKLKQTRKTALRLGKLLDAKSWMIKPQALKDVLEKKRTFESLTDDDFSYVVHQKSVDMKIGLDIASVCYKKHVERIILIAGDSDFVPAAKLARREGIDFILDPMWQHISPDLLEHIDGLHSTCFHLTPSKENESKSTDC